MIRSILLTAISLISVCPLIAQERISFRNEVKPLFREHCFRCHSSIKSESELRLDSVEAILRGGDGGEIVHVEEIEASELLKRIISDDPDFRMPPEGKPLPKEEVELIRKWLSQKPTTSDSDERHWAFEVPQRDELPAVRDASFLDGENPIDVFLQARREELELSPVEQAPPHVLTRRAYLDLIGLPPTAEQANSFYANQSPQAFEELVDQLLASPQYGERWGRHWMDVWRYSDWSGYQKEVRNSQPHIWRWRDWIVESLNDDKSYAEMIREMLAADEIAPTDPEALRATGFLVRNWYKFNRNTWMQNTIEHTSKGFLGITIGCAQCHDHMYDEISHQDYYRFRAIFEPHEIRTEPYLGKGQMADGQMVRIYDKHLQTPTLLFTRGDERKPDKDQSLEPALPALFAKLEIAPVELPPQAYYPSLAPQLQLQLIEKAKKEIEAAEKEFKLKQNAMAAASTYLKSDVNVASQETAPQKKTPLIKDEFDALAQHWRANGDWKTENGKVHQSEIADERQQLLSRIENPRVFVAEYTFTTTGGKQWKSVGFSFDDDEQGNRQTVYLSAYAQGPKFQFAFDAGGKTTYPADAMAPFDMKLNTEYRVKILVGNQLANLFVNDKLVFVYKLPRPRAAGKFNIWTFDATATFDRFELNELSRSDLIYTALNEKPVALADVPDPNADGIQFEFDAANAKLEFARAELDQVQATIAADNAKYLGAADQSQRERLAKIAAKKQAEALVLNLQHQLAAGKLNLLLATGDKAANQIKTNQKLAAELEQAKKSLSETGTSYKPLGELFPSTSSGRRLALANWIASEKNPLTARVAINHIWLRHFGQPLVDSVFDLGEGGQQPSHPKLLDWLAIELMENNWQMKHIHKLIMTSKAYRMQSWSDSSNSQNQQLDPDNRFLWRMNVRRAEGEVVRDSVLHLAKQLDLTRGGPELDEKTGQTTYRRSIYYRHAYEKQMTFLQTFDAASVEECYRRKESVIPQQALAMANSKLGWESAKLIAERLLKTREMADDQFIDAAFFEILSRQPTADEKTLCAEFLKAQQRMNLVHVLLNHNEFVTIR